MRTTIFIFLSFFCFKVGHSQDTLKNLNGGNYGFEQTYILNSDGTFIYSTFGHCTGDKTIGHGRYVMTNRKITFLFDEIDSLYGKAICTNEGHSESLTLNVYDGFDSTRLGYFEYKDSTQHFPFIENQKIRRLDSDFSIRIITYETITVSTDSSCAEYDIFLAPKFDTVPKGVIHTLTKNKRIFQRIERYEYERKKYKNVYDFKLIQNL